MKYNIDKELIHDSSIKIQSIVILIVILSSLASAIYFYFELQKKNIELIYNIEELKIAKKNLEEKEKTIITIQDSLVILIRKLNEVNEDSILFKESERLIKKSNNSNIQIRFHSYQAGILMPDKVYNYLKNQGYSVILYKELDQREDWLSHEPFVFYYMKDMENRAKIIATELSKLIGINFKVTLGAGKTIKKGEESSLINIHLVRR